MPTFCTSLNKIKSHLQAAFKHFMMGFETEYWLKPRVNEVESFEEI